MAKKIEELIMSIEELCSIIEPGAVITSDVSHKKKADLMLVKQYLEMGLEHRKCSNDD